jgi:predicted dinucleotide-binding enzyme
MSDIKTIGILGAGKLGITLARIARHYSFEVNIAGSGSAGKIALTAEVLAPGAKALSAHEVAEKSDVIFLALPLGKFRNIPKQALAGKLVIDAMNYWWEVDGSRDDILPSDQSSSEAVQEFLKDSRVVKAFNHIGYHDLFDEHAPSDSAGRKAIAIAGDTPRDADVVSRLVDRLGFDPLQIGELSEGRQLEPGTNTFGANVSREELQMLLARQMTHQKSAA